MIIPTFSGVRAELDITFDNVPVNYRNIVSIEFEVDENMHDYACVTLKGIPTRALDDYQGVNTYFKLSSGAKYVHEFVGTVEFIVPTSLAREGLMNGSPFQSAELRCYGASYRMRGAVSKVWNLTSLDEMAISMGRKYGFSVDAPRMPLVYDKYLQSAESDWDALVKYSSMHGMRVNLHGTHLHVYDPVMALGRQRSLHKLNTSGRTGLSNTPGKIVEFHPVVGSGASDGVYENTIVTVLNDAGEEYDVSSQDVLGTSGQPRFTRREPHLAHSLREAKASVYSSAANRYDFSASVKCLGLAGAYPGGVVDVDRYNAVVDGYWYVKGVRHLINSSIFSSSLTLMKNRNRGLSEGDSVTPYVDPPLPDLVDNTWVASIRRFNRYA